MLVYIKVNNNNYLRITFDKVTQNRQWFDDKPVVSAAALESLVSDLIARSLKPCQAALKDAGLAKNEIDEVVLVGGMTRMPKVIEEVTKFFGK